MSKVSDPAPEAESQTNRLLPAHFHLQQKQIGYSPHALALSMKSALNPAKNSSEHHLTLQKPAQSLAPLSRN